MLSTRTLARWCALILLTGGFSLASVAADKKVDPSFSGPQPVTESIDLAMYARIREEGLKHSHVMQFAGALSDGIGPRLTGSPNMAKANAWTRETLTAIGLENAHLEDWGEFGMGWQQINTWVRMVSPDPEPLWAQGGTVVAGDEGPGLRRGGAGFGDQRGRPREVQGQTWRQDRALWRDARYTRSDAAALSPVHGGGAEGVRELPGCAGPAAVHWRPGADDDRNSGWLSAHVCKNCGRPRSR